MSKSRPVNADGRAVDDLRAEASEASAELDPGLKREFARKASTDDLDMIAAIASCNVNRPRSTRSKTMRESKTHGAGLRIIQLLLIYSADASYSQALGGGEDCRFSCADDISGSERSSRVLLCGSRYRKRMLTEKDEIIDNFAPTIFDPILNTFRYRQFTDRKVSRHRD